MTCQIDIDDFRHDQVVGAAAHGHRHVQPPGTNCQHAESATVGGVAVRADGGIARDGEMLLVDLVTDTVGGLGKPNPEFSGG